MCKKRMKNKHKEKKEWVAVVNLNTEDKNGYFQSELPKCKLKNYLIGATVKVKAYLDSSNCCVGTRDYNECKDVKGCEAKLLEMEDVYNRHFSREIRLIGPDYSIKPMHYYKRMRKRRLFTSTGSVIGSTANRL